MKQLLLSLESGRTLLEEVPVPLATGTALVAATHSTLVSAGTERMLVEFGRANLLDKARAQPDKVRQVLEKMRTEGVAGTFEAVRAKLAAPMPLGYCHAGVVVATGGSMSPFRVGDRVVTNGPHAEYVRAPHTLTARIPEGVSFERACFTPVAAIGLQGIRLSQPTLGETVVVFGLGLIGLLTVQLLRAHGCRVIGIDIDAGRLAIAERYGALAIDGRIGDPVARVFAATGDIGADAVLLTLTTDTEEPIQQAAQMSRKRGRLVLIGVTRLELSRDEFYKRELSFMVSASYGPGRYDAAYEERGQDYPLAYVRWTAQRNFQAVLALMAEGRLDPEPLITHRFDFADAAGAYRVVTGGEPSLGVVLTYPEPTARTPDPESRVIQLSPSKATGGRGVVGVIGAGNFAVRTMLPVLRASGMRLRGIASPGGTGAAVAGRRFGFEVVSSDPSQILADPEIDTVFVLTRHDSHARLVLQALRAGKHVFVEKPLALVESDLDDIVDAARQSGRLVMVGFNRRFAPLTAEVQLLLRGRAGPLSIVTMVNAGPLSRSHWTQDAAEGGGRIAGEACHWIDLSRALVGAPIVDLHVTSARDNAGEPVDDIAHLGLSFADGSTAVVHYLATGSTAYPKERIECFFDGKIVLIDNWRRLRRYGLRTPTFEFARKVEKGHQAQVELWLRAVRAGGPAPVPLEEVIEVSRWSLRAGQLARGEVLGSDLT